MPSTIRVGLVGDFDATFRPHQATEQALRHAADRLHIELESAWLPTATLDPLQIASVQGFDALWCMPGSPYQSMIGALNAIRFAREAAVPFLGTCAGFQHIVIEYARNVLGFVDAQHAEYDPNASTLFITPLSCSLVGQTMQVTVEPESRAGRCYQQTQVQEEYYCNFGLNPALQTLLHDGGLQVVGSDQDGEARIVELPNHPFFIGTLFVPQLTSTPERPHPLIVAYLEAAARFHESTSRDSARRVTV